MMEVHPYNTHTAQKEDKGVKKAQNLKVQTRTDQPDHARFNPGCKSQKAGFVYLLF